MNELFVGVRKFDDVRSEFLNKFLHVLVRSLWDKAGDYFEDAAR
jgi:hypothetical protein